MLFLCCCCFCIICMRAFTCINQTIKRKVLDIMLLLANNIQEIQKDSGQKQAYLSFGCLQMLTAEGPFYM